MCFIVDTSARDEFFYLKGDGKYRPLRKLLFGKQNAVCLVVCNALLTEYLQRRELQTLLNELDIQGKISRACEKKWHKNFEAMCGNDNVTCDKDHHVLALAAATTVRLLVANDGALRADFTNPKVLRPKGRLYSPSCHSEVLRIYCRHG